MPRLGQHIRPRIVPEPPPIEGARWIPLTQGALALVDEEDFDRIASKSWSYHRVSGYAFRRAPPGRLPKQIRMHREVMDIWDPAIEVDHRDGHGLNCRRANLRLATHTENNRNNRGHKRRIAPFKGVSPSGRPRQPWHAKITVEGRTVNLGRFANLRDAALAYDQAARTHFGEFARLNFPASDQ